MYSLFDKREDFPFSIIRMPHSDSNIWQQSFYSSIVGEFLRIAISSMLYCDFIPKAKAHISRIKNQEAQIQKVKCVIRKLIIKHTDIFSNFQVSSENLLSDILE